MALPLASGAALHGAGGRGTLVTSPASTSQPAVLLSGRRSAAAVRRASGAAAAAAGAAHGHKHGGDSSQWHPWAAASLLPLGPGGRATCVRCQTMAPDKSAMVTNLNQLLRLTDSSEGQAAAGAQQGAAAWSAPLPPPGTRASSSSRAPTPAPRAPGPTLPALSPLPTPTPEDDYHPSDGWRPRSHHLQHQQLWERIREEAALDAVLEPALATHLHSVILSHRSMDSAMAFLLANKLADGMMLGAVQLMSLFREAYAADPSLLAAGVADMNAVLDRDPACAKYSQCMLQFKGYQAVQVYRVTHHLWQQGRHTLALALQSRVCELFSVDIHPAAVLGRGVMLDHATGIVIGETTVVGDNVVMLHHVSLGGSGTGRRVRHPQIGHGVLLGAGVAVLGPVSVGAGCKIGAGSVVVTDLPAHCVAVGVPARIVKRDIRDEPVREMDQCGDFILDYVI